ncbi:MAG: nickel pincer cofactor biosynthesis protein LarB [Bacteroidota bacterium]
MKSNKHKPTRSSHSLESFANLDFHRRERTGIPEAIFAEGKTVDQVVLLTDQMVERAGMVLVTRISAEMAREVKTRVAHPMKYYESARAIVAIRGGFRLPATGGAIAVLAAGTSDLPVAEEARVTAECMGCTVSAFYDVGVAGIHRLVGPLEHIHEKKISAVVVVAGMEGALPTVVRGLVAVPVIGVPTSVGYGYGGKGEAALMTMLQSCAPGLTVVNIDNGFGAGATAALIANRVAEVMRSPRSSRASREKSRS